MTPLCYLRDTARSVRWYHRLCPSPGHAERTGGRVPPPARRGRPRSVPPRKLPVTARAPTSRSVRVTRRVSSRAGGPATGHQPARARAGRRCRTDGRAPPYQHKIHIKIVSHADGLVGAWAWERLPAAGGGWRGRRGRPPPATAAAPLGSIPSLSAADQR